jgi:hypothetical protein
MQSGAEHLFVRALIFIGVAQRRIMSISALTRSPTSCAIHLVCSSRFNKSQVLSDQAAHNRQTLKNVVFFEPRRCPLSDQGAIGFYPSSAVPWPQCSVPPGYRTAQGFSFIKLFGANDRADLAAKGLLSPAGCRDPSAIASLTDSELQQPRDIESTGIPQHWSRILTSLAQESVFRRRDTSKEAKCNQAAIFHSSF